MGIHVYGMSKVGNRDRRQTSGVQGLGGGGVGRRWLSGYGFFLRGDEMILNSVEEVVTDHCHGTVCLEKVNVI